MHRLLRRYSPALPLLALVLIPAILATRPEPANAHHLCGNTGSIFGPFNFQTYEAADYRHTYARTMELAGFNQLSPEHGSFALPGIEGVQPSPYIPPVLLKAIAWLESGWAQADYSVPYGASGATLISHDCGYGIMQVTTGMQNVSGVPNLDQAMIGGHYAFNIARGARILADKWNLAPEYRPVVGSRNSHIIEDWYYALWGYNGFAWKNHPMNPIYDPNRGPYFCDGTQPRSAFPYQELVIGCVNYPPRRGGVQLWAPQPAWRPNLNDPTFAGLADINRFYACIYNLQCAGMNIPTPNPWHVDPTTPGLNRGQVIGNPVMGISTNSITLAAPPGGQSQTSLTISNPGSGLLAWRATSSASWLRLSRIQGVSLGGDLGSMAQTLNVSANAAGLINGSRHSGIIRIETLYPASTFAQIEVVLQVSGDFSVSNVQPWPGYGMQTGSWQAGDFNGDGMGDLIHLCCEDYAHLWTALGNGSFTVSSVKPWPGYGMQTGSWQAGDFNGDGKGDLLHLCCRDYAHLWTSLGNGSFVLSSVNPWPGYGMQLGSWQSADFNGDGKGDLLHLCCRDYAHLWTSLGTGNFALSSVNPWPDYGMQLGSWRVGDFNGDGKGDLLHLCCRDYAHLWTSVGNGSFVLSSVQPWSEYGMQIGSWQAGDFNGDGRTDLVHLCCRDYSHVWFSLGEGKFTLTSFRPWSEYAMQLGLWQGGDFNGDGKSDLVHLCCRDYAHLWLSHGNGSFDLRSFSPWPEYALQRGQWVGGYFSSDGREDLLHTCCQDHAHLWLAVPP